jgi:hypothetical protein
MRGEWVRKEERGKRQRIVGTVNREINREKKDMKREEGRKQQEDIKK